jgi:hypothetical protein
MWRRFISFYFLQTKPYTLNPMVYINEWLPNPVGNDATGEFVELFNGGSAPVNVNGWTLETSAKKPKKISGVIPVNGYLTLYRKQTKLVLKNSNEGIALYDVTGKLVDQSSFVGTAPEGKSFSRIGGTEPLPASPWKGEGASIQNFAWGEPTPGAANRVEINNSVPITSYAFNSPINKISLNLGTGVAMMLAVAVCVTALVMYSVKQYDGLSDLFFGGN